MRRRPWALVILAVLHLMAPLGNVVMNALIANRDVVEYLSLSLSSAYITKNWIMLVAPIIAGISIYACKRWSFYVYLFSITALFAFSYIGYQSKMNSITLWPVLFVYLINVGIVTYFLIPAVRSIYFDRRLRWWEIQARYRCDLQCQWFSKSRNETQPGHVENISENGLFLKAEVYPDSQSMVEITLPVGSDTEVKVEGEAILHNRVDAIGFGVKFKHTAESKRLIKQIVADLDAQGLRISTLDLRPEDSFTYWVRTLMTTGKGLLPRRENR